MCKRAVCSALNCKNNWEKKKKTRQIWKLCGKTNNFPSPMESAPHFFILDTYMKAGQIFMRVHYCALWRCGSRSTAQFARGNYNNVEKDRWDEVISGKFLAHLLSSRRAPLCYRGCLILARLRHAMAWLDHTAASVSKHGVCLGWWKIIGFATSSPFRSDFPFFFFLVLFSFSLFYFRLC